MFVISIVAFVEFPAKSFIVIVSVLFVLYSFVNVLLSVDKVHPVSPCTFSLAVIVTLTF